MSRQIITLLVTFLYFTTGFAENTTKSVPAVRSAENITIDGVLSENIWMREAISGFIQKDPNEGAPATEKTDVWVAYDDEALYVAARLYDSHPDSIVSRIVRRDDFTNADWFYLGVDSYHDKRTGFFFGVYPSGSLIDGVHYNDSWDDGSWDGVWEAKTTIDDKGWNVEMKIPYSQMRFSKQEEYVWGINFARNIERRKEESQFVMVPKGESGWISRFADLTGIKDINPPTRLEILPYVVSSNKFTNNFSKGDPFNDGSSFFGNTGADVKFGIGNNLTLNATINPDFGQVEVDPAVVNLSQFETFYDEKRPFFIEGSNYLGFGYGGANNNFGFNWGNPDFFYTRRVGRSPQGGTQHGDDVYEEYPDGTTILGAAKVTGKISDGWSLGSVVALTEREYASVHDKTTSERFSDVVEPFTTYGVLRSQKEFHDGNQALGFIGTATIRDLNENYLLDNFNEHAFAFGVDGWTNLDEEQMWVVTGWNAFTRVEGTKTRIVSMQRSSRRYYQRPDATHLGVDSSATSLNGNAGRFAINKQKGNLKFNAAFGYITPGFESNDLGYQFRADVLNGHIVTGYNWFEPDGMFRRKSFQVATFRNYDFEGNRLNEGYFLFYNFQTMNYFQWNGDFMMQRASLDNRGTRGGPLMMNTNMYATYFEVSTDSRKELELELGMQAGRSESGGYRYSYSTGLEWKPSTNATLKFSPEFVRDVTIAQWVDSYEDEYALSTFGKRYIFGRIDQKEISASIRMDYIFTPNLSLQLYIQPLISVGTYDKFKELKTPKMYTFNRFGEDNGSTVSYDEANDEYTIDADGSNGISESYTFSNPNFNFKSLRGNAVLRWEYLPGSTLYFVWTRGQENGTNAGDFNVGRDFRNLLTTPETNNDAIVIKFSYWWNPS
ncbi:MAG: DUF5916 domain-containing protein [Bacteroidota bacterium]